MACRFVSTLVCGTYPCCGFTFTISHNGEVFSFGTNKQSAVYHKRVKIKSLQNIHSLDCGGAHTICLDNEGNVYSFGLNYKGELGVSDTQGISKNPPHLVALPPIKQVSCGNEFTICVSEDGDVYSFGINEYGQIGLGDCESSKVPQKVLSLKEVDFCECGVNYTICKTFNDEIYVWGKNDFGQLGIGNFHSHRIPFKCLDWPDDIVDIKCGMPHTLVLTSNQTVYSCGSNYSGQLGRNKNIKFSSNLKVIKNLFEIVRIECGASHSLCIDIYNNIYVFGYNYFGQLGLGDRNNRYKPIKHPSLSNIIDISCGGNHTFVKTFSNEIYAFGNNTYEQLGIKTCEVYQLTPIRVFEDNEDIWYSIKKSRAKSARK